MNNPLAIILVVLIIVLAFGGYAGRGSLANPYYAGGFSVVGLVVIVVLVLVLLGHL